MANSGHSLATLISSFVFISVHLEVSVSICQGQGFPARQTNSGFSSLSSSVATIGSPQSTCGFVGTFPLGERKSTRTRRPGLCPATRVATTCAQRDTGEDSRASLSMRATSDTAASAVAVAVSSASTFGAGSQTLPNIMIRAALPEEVDEAAALSMEAFFGLQNLDLFNASQVFRIYTNTEGEPYNAVQYSLQRWNLVSRLEQSTRRARNEPQPADAEQTVQTPNAVEAVFVAQDGVSGKIVGLVELIALPYPAQPSPQQPYLFNLCVDRRWRNQGIGGMLVKRCEEEAVRLGYNKLFLHTETDTARQIYLKLGYKATYQQPTWVELNLFNKVAPAYDASARGRNGWVIMARDLDSVVTGE